MSRMDDGDYLLLSYECEYLLVLKNNSTVGDIQDHQAWSQMTDRRKKVGAVVCKLRKGMDEAMTWLTDSRKQ